MNNIKWIFAIIIAFITGYCFHSIINNSITAENERTIQESVAQQPKPSLQSEVVVEQSRAVEKIATKSEKTLSSNITSPLAQKEDIPKSIPKNSVGDITDKVDLQSRSNEISDTDIDKFVPAPFNESLKHHHGALREKFKEYANATTADDWSIKMQDKISDFILSNQYAKYINLEFVGCKTGLCELRLYENKSGTWSHILSEMALQDWWDIGGYSSSGNLAGAEKPDTLAWHVLLPKK